MAEVDRDGLDKNDRSYLETLIDVFGGGPTGVEALAATMNLAADTLTDEIEPYLLARAVHRPLAARPRRHAAGLHRAGQNAAQAEGGRQAAGAVRIRFV